ANNRFGGPNGNVRFSRPAPVTADQLLMKFVVVVGDLSFRVERSKIPTLSEGTCFCHASRARNAHTRNADRSISTAIRENPAFVKRPNAEAGATGTNVLL